MLIIFKCYIFPPAQLCAQICVTLKKIFTVGATVKLEKNRGGQRKTLKLPVRVALKWNSLCVYFFCPMILLEEDVWQCEHVAGPIDSGTLREWHFDFTKH